MSSLILATVVSMMNQANTTPALRPLSCIECERSWLVGSERWRLKVSDEDPPEAVLYCPACAEREFGSD